MQDATLSIYGEMCGHPFGRLNAGHSGEESNTMMNKQGKAISEPSTGSRFRKLFGLVLFATLTTQSELKRPRSIYFP
jgi:hypothetical protein